MLSSAEASSNLARFDGLKFGEDLCDGFNYPSDDLDMRNSRERHLSSSRAKGFGVEVKRRMLAGTAVLSSDRYHSFYESAANIRAAISTQFDRAFNDENGVDLILIPTSITDPPKFEDRCTPNRTEAFENDIMTTPVSLAGLPSVSIPVMDIESMTSSTTVLKQYPFVGIQLIGSKYSEQTILRAADTISKLVK